MPEEPFPGYHILPEGDRRLIDDGLGKVTVNDGGGDGPITGFYQGPSIDEIAAMTPEQREYYGLTAFYESVQKLPPPEQWPKESTFMASRPAKPAPSAEE